MTQSTLKSQIAARRAIEAEIRSRITAEHHDLFYYPTNAEFRARGGPDETMRQSDSDYIYALADYIVGGRKSAPSDGAYRVKTNGSTGRERLKIIQKIGREMKRGMGVAATQEP